MNRTRLACVFGILVAGGLLDGAPIRAEQATKDKPMAQTIQDGMQVQIDYTLTVDGNVVDSSKDRGPLSYVHGKGQLVPGLERQLTGLQTGDVKKVTVSPEEGYGPLDPKAILEVPRKEFSSEMSLQVGMTVSGAGKDGRSFRATIREVKQDTVTLDLNHPLAGKTLQFDVKVVEIAPAKNQPTPHS